MSGGLLIALFLWLSFLVCFGLAVLPVEAAASAGGDGVGVGAQEDGHFAVGGAGMVLQVVFYGFFRQVEIVFRFRTGKPVPELLQDFVDGPDLGQAHQSIRFALGLFPDGIAVAFQDVVQQGQVCCFLFLSLIFPFLDEGFQFLLLFPDLLQKTFCFRLFQPECFPLLVQDFFFFEEGCFDFVHGAFLRGLQGGRCCLTGYVCCVGVYVGGCLVGRIVGCLDVGFLGLGFFCCLDICFCFLFCFAFPALSQGVFDEVAFPVKVFVVVFVDEHHPVQEAGKVGPDDGLFGNGLSGFRVFFVVSQELNIGFAPVGRAPAVDPVLNLRDLCQDNAVGLDDLVLFQFVYVKVRVAERVVLFALSFHADGIVPVVPVPFVNNRHTPPLRVTRVTRQQVRCHICSKNMTRQCCLVTLLFLTFSHCHSFSVLRICCAWLLIVCHVWCPVRADDFVFHPGLDLVAGDAHFNFHAPVAAVDLLDFHRDAFEGRIRDGEPAVGFDDFGFADDSVFPVDHQGKLLVRAVETVIPVRIPQAADDAVQPAAHVLRLEDFFFRADKNITGQHKMLPVDILALIPGMLDL